MGTLRARKIRKEVYGAQTALATSLGRTYRLLKIAKKIKDEIIYRDIVHADDRRKRYQLRKKALKSVFIHRQTELCREAHEKAFHCIELEKRRIQRKERRKE